MVWDSYRPQEVQKALFDDSTRPPPHNTGGSIDLTKGNKLIHEGKILAAKAGESLFVKSVAKKKPDIRKIKGLAAKKLEV